MYKCFLVLLMDNLKIYIRYKQIYSKIRENGVPLRSVTQVPGFDSLVSIKVWSEEVEFCSLMDLEQGLILLSCDWSLCCLWRLLYVGGNLGLCFRIFVLEISVVLCYEWLNSIFYLLLKIPVLSNLILEKNVVLFNVVFFLSNLNCSNFIFVRMY